MIELIPLLFTSITNMFSPQWLTVLLGNLIYAPMNLVMVVLTYLILDKVLLGKIKVSDEIKGGNWTVTVFVSVVLFAVLFSGKTAVGSPRIDPAYREYVQKAHARYFGRGSEVPSALIVAQFYQESRFNPRAVSPVGARGVAQIMPGTQKDLQRRLGKFNALNARDSIYAGTFYISDRYHVFRHGKKTLANRMALALSSYNAGLGYVLQAQELAGYPDSQRWFPVKEKLFLVPRVIAKEPVEYVSRIFRYYHRSFKAKRDPILRLT